MKRSWLLFILCLALSFVSCNKKNDNIITYTSDDIYLNFVECGHISGFPKELLIFETGEQLECALNSYESIASLMDLDAVTEEYPIGEYIYLLQYFDTDIDSKVECKGLNVYKEEKRIYFEHKIKSPKEGPAAITAYVTYAALPKEYLDGCDFSEQQGVLYWGRTTEIDSSRSENPRNETTEPPCTLNFESFEKIAELRSMLEEEEDTVAEYLDSNNYSMNGLSTKEEIAGLFNEIGDLMMFHMDPSSGYGVAGIIYYPEYEYILSTYSNGRHSDTLRFVCYIGGSDEKDTANPVEGEETAVITLRIGDEEVALYKVEENASHKLAGRTATSNSRITILLFDDNEETVRNEIEGHIVTATLLELVENSDSKEKGVSE